MKKILKKLTEKLTLSIKSLTNKIKIWMIKNALSNVLKKLAEIKHENISDVELLSDKLFFRYFGAKFFVIQKIVLNDTNAGYLTVYHETPLPKDNIKPVEDFYLRVDNLGNTQITNYLQNQMSEYLRSITQSNLITAQPNEIASTFVKHFEAKLKNEAFEIYLS